MEEAKEGLISRLRLEVGGWGLGVGGFIPPLEKGGIKTADPIGKQNDRSWSWSWSWR